MSKRIDIRGEVYNNLLPLRFIKNQNTHALWKCKCLKCGKATYATYINIVSGNTKSCASCGNKKALEENDNLTENEKSLIEWFVSLASNHRGASGGEVAAYRLLMSLTPSGTVCLNDALYYIDSSKIYALLKIQGKGDYISDFCEKSVLKS